VTWSLPRRARQRRPGAGDGSASVLLPSRVWRRLPGRTARPPLAAFVSVRTGPERRLSAGW